MKVIYMYNNNMVIADVEYITLAPVTEHAPSRVKEVTIGFFDGTSVCLGRVDDAGNIYSQALNKEVINLTGYKFK